MKRLMNLLRGTVALCVTGPFPERLLNLCAQHRLDFWRLEWLPKCAPSFFMHKAPTFTSRGFVIT